MNMKKAIALAILVVGTMTMTGSAFAGPRIHNRYHGSSHALRWEHQRRVAPRHNVIRRREAVRRHIAHTMPRHRDHSGMRMWRGRR